MSPVVVALAAPRQVVLLEEPRRALAPDEVRLRTLSSGISAGTELAYYRGTNPFLHKHWDPSTRLFVEDGRAALSYPITTWGYEEVGEVVEVGSDVGDRVQLGSLAYGTWGHRSEHVASAAYVRDRLLPPGADPLLGMFSHIGAIALNGTLDAAPRLTETVAVFGLGVVGLLAAQLLARAGARVIAVDLLAERRAMVQTLGVAEVLDAAEEPADQIKALTDGRGADVCVEASGAPAALHQAIRACAYASRVVALGFYQGEPRGLFLGDEFHHNRISIVCSQIGGVAPELQHRWDRQRLVRSFMRLAAEGAVRWRELITHRVPFSEAPAAYAQLDEQPQSVLQAVLDFA